ncbi:aquaporin, putative [Ixodes scapularis]|uniref:Aquaporin, putative n=1 Tax=Ixodes scapularis TaxID=6945 RepID=B7QAG0_IXOSC|nr:aquaporin, putative [Ixodes scapularis]|eukprot:XP_002400655.1 aquaporin, putative [Ixodes scapularis]
MKPNSVARVWSRICNCRLESRSCRDVLAEFLGTLILTLIGDSVLASLTASRLGYFGIAAGPLASAGKFKWAKVLPYIAAQYLGAFAAAGLIFLLYQDALYKVDGGMRVVYGPNATASVFSCFPAPEVRTLTCLLDQVVSTAVLLVSICAIVDPKNMAVLKGHQPLLIGFAVAACMYAFSYNCGNPLNPARDLAPRIFTAMAGWGCDVFSIRGYNWFWVPVVGPHVGGVVGVWIYKFAVENHWATDAAAVVGKTPEEEHDYEGKRRLLRQDTHHIEADIAS